MQQCTEWNYLEIMQEQEQKRIFDEWLDEHKGLFFKVVRAYAFTPQDQDDLFQEIAIQVWDSVPNFRGESSVGTWIYRVALYTAMSWARQEIRDEDRKRPLTAVAHTLIAQPVQGRRPFALAVRSNCPAQRNRPLTHAAAARWVQLQRDGVHFGHFREQCGRQN